ncbi:MAG: sigma-54-dependent Fis family transcriptional regulator [Planctomycetes bacterium]|nr:sigma-54-dependent Fis family transcriptional regulator [Planctomycetota bacterium]
MHRVLLIDDEADFRSTVAEFLTQSGYEVRALRDGTGVNAELLSERWDAILSDLQLPGLSGLDVLARVRAVDPAVPFFIITAFASLESAIEALRQGATDYLLKPLKLDSLRTRLDRAVRFRALQSENLALRREVASLRGGGLVGRSPGLRNVHDLILKVGPNDRPVLILGESGSGKELVARALHEASPRAPFGFTAVNVAAIPESLLESELFGHVKGSFTGATSDKEGLFAAASRGTLFLDELAEAPLSLQVKLLRVLESHEFMPVGSTKTHRSDARVIAATNRDLKKRVEEKLFREDLYYRLSVLEVRVPALRERREDIPELVEHFAAKVAAEAGRRPPAIAAEAMRVLSAYDWPGNVRQLRNVVERMVILGPGQDLGTADLPPEVMGPAGTGQATMNLRGSRKAFERQHILWVLREYGGDKVKAAEALGINLSSLYRKLEGEDTEEGGSRG